MPDFGYSKSKNVHIRDRPNVELILFRSNIHEDYIFPKTRDIRSNRSILQTVWGSHIHSWNGKMHSQNTHKTKYNIHGRRQWQWYQNIKGNVPPNMGLIRNVFRCMEQFLKIPSWLQTMIWIPQPPHTEFYANTINLRHHDYHTYHPVKWYSYKWMTQSTQQFQEAMNVF